MRPAERRTSSRSLATASSALRRRFTRGTTRRRIESPSRCRRTSLRGTAEGARTTSVLSGWRTVRSWELRRRSSWQSDSVWRRRSAERPDDLLEPSGKVGRQLNALWLEISFDSATYRSLSRAASMADIPLGVGGLAADAVPLSVLGDRRHPHRCGTVPALRIGDEPRADKGTYFAC
jgi:hypothetical protein